MATGNIPAEVVEDMFKSAMNRPSRGRKKNGQPTSRNISGLTGAYQKSGQKNGYGKWYSRIRINGKTIHLKNSEGKTYFHSAEEAHKAYLNAAIQHGLIS